MTRHQVDPYIWEFDPDLFEQVDESVFDPNAWKQKQSIIGQESGRGTTYFLQHGSMQLVLRHYLRGGLVGKLNRDHYLFTQASSCRSLHEYGILEQLIQKGLPVPRPVAAQVIRKGLVYQADLIIERIPQAKDLVSVLQQTQDTSFYERLAACIARFHRHKVYHADLNIKNILLDENQQFWLIDFDRAQIDASDKLLQRSVARLKRSFEKEKGRHQIAFDEGDWQTFERAYRQALKQ